VNSEPWSLMVSVLSLGYAPGAPQLSGRVPFSQLLDSVLQVGALDSC